MLSQTEKKEMLKDARNKKLGARFKKALVKDAAPSLDDYLIFLNSVQKAFSQNISAPRKPSRQKFKL